MDLRGRGRVIALGLAVALTAAACGDDGGSSTSTAAGATTTSAAPTGDGGSGSGASVVVPQVDPALAGVFIEGAAVDVGEVAEMGPLVVTVESIEAVTDGGTVAVAMTTDNVTDSEQAGPDVYSVCADDGRFGVTTVDSEIQSLEILAPGEGSAGVAELEVPADCTQVLVQVRVLAVEVGGDHIAEYEVPA